MTSAPVSSAKEALNPLVSSIESISPTLDTRIAKIIEKASSELSDDLILSDMSLTSLPEEISTLRHVRHLNLEGNQFIEIPHVLFSIDLFELKLGKNKISALPEILKSLSVRLLSLNDNEIAELPENDIWPDGLSILDLSNNPLKKIPKSLLEKSELVLILSPGDAYEAASLEVDVRKECFLNSPSIVIKE